MARQENFEHRRRRQRFVLVDAFAFCDFNGPSVMWILLQRGTSQALLQAQTKQWLAVREKRLPLPPLSPKVLAFIKEWYFLVDTDGSGELSLDEVAAAMRVLYAWNQALHSI